MKTEMKPMIYDANGRSSILYHETEREDGFEIVIVNVRGSHPCAYINVPESFLAKEAEKYGKKEPDLDCYSWFADVHGGFTYANREMGRFSELKRGYWLGLDYADYGDYTAMPGIAFRSSRLDEKVWTTEEIYQQALQVIKTLEYCDNPYSYELMDED